MRIASGVGSVFEGGGDDAVVACAGVLVVGEVEVVVIDGETVEGPDAAPAIFVELLTVKDLVEGLAGAVTFINSGHCAPTGSSGKSARCIGFLYRSRPRRGP